MLHGDMFEITCFKVKSERILGLLRENKFGKSIQVFEQVKPLEIQQIIMMMIMMLLHVMVFYPEKVI